MTPHATQSSSSMSQNFANLPSNLFTTMRHSNKDNYHYITNERGHNNDPGTPLMVPNTLNKIMKSELYTQDSVWLWASRHGVSANEMASREGISTRRVRFGLAAARCRETSCFLRDVRHPPRLVPLFPLGPYTPQSDCRHHRPIERGSLFCCMVCHRSGQDDHPALQHDARVNRRLDANSSPPLPKRAAEEQTRRETRKQRRQRLFGAKRSCANAVRL